MTFYTDAQRKIQTRHQSSRMAAALEQAIIAQILNDDQAAFIQSRDFFFLSTVTASGEPTVSYKGGDIGVVTVLDESTLAFPAYDGNGMFLSLGNIADTAKIGLLFIDFETPNRLRVQATAQLLVEDELLERYPGAIGVVRARIDHVFPNCARYIHKHVRGSSSAHVPDAAGEQPVATWKRIDDFQDYLSTQDRSQVAEAGGTISAAEYGEALMRGES